MSAYAICPADVRLASAFGCRELRTQLSAGHAGPIQIERDVATFCNYTPASYTHLQACACRAPTLLLHVMCCRTGRHLLAPSLHVCCYWQCQHGASCPVTWRHPARRTRRRHSAHQTAVDYACIATVARSAAPQVYRTGPARGRARLCGCSAGMAKAAAASAGALPRALQPRHEPG